MGYEDQIFPLYVSKISNEQVLNILLTSNEEKSHYAFFRDFNRLMYSEVKTKNEHENTSVWHVYKILLRMKY